MGRSNKASAGTLELMGFLCVGASQQTGCAGGDTCRDLIRTIVVPIRCF